MTLKLNTFIYTAVLSLLFVACTKHHSAGNTTIIPPTDCKACVYIPTCVGDSFTYIDSSVAGPAVQSEIDYLAEKDTIINGAIFQDLTTTTGNTYYSCNDGITTTIGTGFAGALGDPSLQNIKAIILKSNGTTGTSWTDTLSYEGEAVYAVSTITESNISRNVLTVNFTNVIHVVTVVSVVVPFSGYEQIAGADFYYAKNIGLIENDFEDNTNTVIEHTWLKSYSIAN